MMIFHNTYFFRIESRYIKVHNLYINLRRSRDPLLLWLFGFVFVCVCVCVCVCVRACVCSRVSYTLHLLILGSCYYVCT